MASLNVCHDNIRQNSVQCCGVKYPVFPKIVTILPSICENSTFRRTFHVDVKKTQTISCHHWFLDMRFTKVAFYVGTYWFMIQDDPHPFPSANSSTSLPAPLSNSARKYFSASFIFNFFLVVTLRGRVKA